MERHLDSNSWACFKTSNNFSSSCNKIVELLQLVTINGKKKIHPQRLSVESTKENPLTTMAHRS